MMPGKAEPIWDSRAARRFYDRISRAYDFIADASEHAVRDCGIRMLRLSSGESVLEVGSGTGHGLVAIASLIGSRGRVYGIDVSAGMISVAADRVASTPFVNVRFVQADARALSFRTDAFDAVFFSFTLELLGDAIPSALREARRVLRPTGRIGVVSLADSPESGPVTNLYQWMHRHFPRVVDCTPIDVSTALGDVGFDVERVFATTMWTLPVTAVVGRIPPQT
jgi:demethylmenaquinone methyltransferase/2-methoxy-6-polyprenyl-1,4-benzoquinol methylase